MEYTEKDFINTILKSKPISENKKYIKKTIKPKFQYWFYSDCEIEFNEVWSPIKQEAVKILNPFSDLEIYKKYINLLWEIICELYDQEVEKNKLETLQQIGIDYKNWLKSEE